MDKKVLIIIPAFNAEKYLRKCLDSVFAQTYKNIEVICVDDGSKDNSLDILNEYKKNHENLVVVHKDNGGPASARNAALSTLKDFNGYFITFIDADDWVEEDYIRKLIELQRDNDVDVVCGSFLFANDEYSKPYKNVDNEKVVSGLEATQLLLLDETIQSHTPTKLYKSEIWKDLAFDDSILFMEDQAFIFKTLYKAEKVFISNYAGYYYRQDNMNSLTKAPVNNKKVLNGLYAYYSICINAFSDEDKITLVPPAQSALVAAYLMLIPYYKKKEASKEDKAFIKELKKYIKDNKLVKKYIPNGRSNAIKRRMYLLFPHLYSVLFKMFKKVNK